MISTTTITLVATDLEDLFSATKPRDIRTLTALAERVLHGTERIHGRPPSLPPPRSGPARRHHCS